MFGAGFAFLSVALGAFGAHGLKNLLSPEMLAVWRTAVQYQMFHALALLLIGVLMQTLSSTKLLTWSARAMIVGVILFSGSLYALALSGVGKLGMITPLGGLAFLAGWVLLFLAVRNADESL